jgi:ATP synthase F1 gamma subunit
MRHRLDNQIPIIPPQQVAPFAPQAKDFHNLSLALNPVNNKLCLPDKGSVKSAAQPSICGDNDQQMNGKMGMPVHETVTHGEQAGRQKLDDDRFGDALAFAAKLQSLLESYQFGEASILFNIFRSVLLQEVAHHSLIPFQVIPWEQETIATSLYEYEPNPDALLAHLLPRYLAVSIYRVFLEHHASEQGARMTAMENATRNAKDMIKRLELTYNQTRQAYITKELIEIISGAEALK